MFNLALTVTHTHIYSLILTLTLTLTLVYIWVLGVNRVLHVTTNYLRSTKLIGRLQLIVCGGERLT